MSKKMMEDRTTTMEKSHSQVAYQRAMVAATLLNSHNSGNQAVSLSSRDQSVVFRLAMQKAIDLLRLAEDQTLGSIAAYRLFKPEENDLSLQAVAKRFQNFGWHKLGSPQSVDNVFKKVREHCSLRWAKLIEDHLFFAEYQEDRPSLTFEDPNYIKDCVEQITAWLCKHRFPKTKADNASEDLTELLEKMLGKKNYFENFDDLERRLFGEPYLQFIVNVCFRRESARTVYFPYEILLYAATYLPDLVPAKWEWELKFQVGLTDAVPEGLGPESRVTEIWTRPLVPPAYMMPGLVRRHGRYYVDLSQTLPPIPEEEIVSPIGDPFGLLSSNALENFAKMRGYPIVAKEAPPAKPGRRNKR